MSLVESTTPSEARSLVLCSGTVPVSLPASQRDIGFLMLHMLQSLPRAAKEALGYGLCARTILTQSVSFFAAQNREGLAIALGGGTLLRLHWLCVRDPIPFTLPFLPQSPFPSRNSCLFLSKECTHIPIFLTLTKQGTAQAPPPSGRLLRSHNT